MIISAGDLWKHWIDTRALHPQSYDNDIADDLENRLPPPTPGTVTLADRLDLAGWTARDLIRLLAPHLASFSSMLRDLLAMYTRIGAVSTDRENLRVSYEFEEGHTVDVELHAFRETVERLERYLAQIDQFVYPPGGSFLPSLDGLQPGSLADLWDRASRATGMDLDAYRALAVPEVCPLPDATGDPEIDQLSVRHRQVIDAVIALANSSGASSTGFKGLSEDFRPHQAYFDLGDCWLATQIGLNQYLTSGGKVASELASRKARADFKGWLDKFWKVSTIEEEVLVEYATDVLNLPEWGQRHDLYASWITTQFDAALSSAHLKFHVVNGTFGFPFKENLLATLETPGGPVELWSELRQAASGPLSGGRKSGVQPDYQFTFGKTRTPLIAVEVKQYRRANATTHRRTMRDYLAHLAQATVILVGHGPLGRTIESKLPATLQPRARVHEKVRPGEPMAQRAFQNEIATLLPSPGALVPPFPSDGSVAARLTLTWEARGSDLELGIFTLSEDLLETARQCPATPYAEFVVGCADGCPQVLDILALPDQESFVFVRQTDGKQSIVDIGPKLTILGADGSTRTFIPAEDQNSKGAWAVGWWNGALGQLSPWGREDAPEGP